MKLKKEFDDFFQHIKIDTEINTLMLKRTILQGEIENKLPGILEELLEPGRNSQYGLN